MNIVVYLLLCIDWAPVRPVAPLPNPVPPKADHGTLYKQAVQENKPLAVYVSTPVRSIPGTIGYETLQFEGVKGPKILVGIPHKGTLYNLELDAYLSDAQVQTAIDVARREFPSRLDRRVVATIGSVQVFETSDPNVRVTSDGKTLRRTVHCNGRSCVETWEQ